MFEYFGSLSEVCVLWELFGSMSGSLSECLKAQLFGVLYQERVTSSCTKSRPEVFEAPFPCPGHMPVQKGNEEWESCD